MVSVTSIFTIYDHSDNVFSEKYFECQTTGSIIPNVKDFQTISEILGHNTSISVFTLTVKP